MAFTSVSIGDVCGVFSSQLCRKYWKKLLDDGEEPTSRMYQKTWRKKKHFTVLSCGRSHFWTRLHSDSRVFSIQGPAALNLKVCLGVAEPKQYGRRGYGMWRLWVIRGWGRNGSCRHLWGREEKPTNRLECFNMLPRVHRLKNKTQHVTFPLQPVVSLLWRNNCRVLSQLLKWPLTSLVEYLFSPAGESWLNAWSETAFF